METISRPALAGTLLCLWILICFLTFWWFQFRPIGPYAEHWVSFSGKDIADLRLTPTSGFALVVHFVDPDCPCSRFSEAHIEQLEQRFSDRVDFRRVESFQNSIPNLRVPAGPAVGIWDKDGQLAYLGPYSGGILCGRGEDFTAITLDALSTGQNPQWINQEAVGCFCPWPNHDMT